MTTMNHPFFSQRAQRRERRLASFHGLGTALRHVASGWDLQERLNGEAFGKPSTLPETIKKAVATTRDVLDEIGEFPMPPTIEYQSIRSVRAAAGGTEQTPLIADGVIMLQARFVTKTGVRDSFDVPVLVQEGQVLQPSVIMHDGMMKVLAPSSVREMVARGTFTQQAPARGLFSGPLTHDEVTQWNQIERDSKTQTRMNPGMFSVNGARELLRAAVRGDAEFDRACMERTARYRIYMPTGDYYHQQEFDTPEEAIEFAKSTGYEARIDDDSGSPVAEVRWDGGVKRYDKPGVLDDVGTPRYGQLGEQPSRANMGFVATPGTRVGDRIVTMVTWDPDRVESMGDKNLHYAIRSFVLELGSKKEWRDWGTIADVQIDEFDRDGGSARVSFKSSEISAPQLSGADFEDLAKEASFSREGAWCEKCQVNHRPGTVCPHSKQKAPKAPKQPKQPKPKKTNLGEKGSEIAAKQPKPDADAHAHMSWAVDNIADAIGEAQHAYAVDGLLRRGPSAATRAADQLVTKLMDAYQGAVTEEGEKVRAMPEGQEKDRAKKIVNMIGSQFSYGGRGLDRQRSPEKTKAVMERVKPLWAELAKLTGGQMQMFARKAGWNDPQAKQIEQLLQSGVAPSTSPALAGMIWDELKQHPQMNEMEASYRLQYGRALDLLNALVDGGILDRSTAEPASERPRSGVQYTLKLASRTAAATLDPGKFYQWRNQFIRVIGPAQSGYAAAQGAVDAELVSHPYDPTHKVLIWQRDFGDWNEVPESAVQRTAAIGPSQDETELQPAERDLSAQFHVGEEVKLTKGQLLRNRGGGVDTVPKGTAGKVVGDMFGDGLTLKVVFDDVSPQAMVIPASHLKHASSVTAAKVIDEIKNLRRSGYSPIDVILTARQRYGALGEEALRQAKADGLLDW